MAETIINSNQLRASGDTSSQTLIGANQIRQSGDSSSQTLLNKNQIASGEKTLNLISVHDAQLDENYIFTNNQFGLWEDLRYFKTKDTVDIRNNANDIEFVIKFQINQFKLSSISVENAIFGYSGATLKAKGIGENLEVYFNNNYQNEQTMTINTWYWLKMTHTANSGVWKFYLSDDGTNYNLLYEVQDTSSVSTTVLNFGCIEGESVHNVGLTGKIDFKETDVIINGQSVLWV